MTKLKDRISDSLKKRTTSLLVENDMAAFNAEKLNWVKDSVGIHATTSADNNIALIEKGIGFYDPRPWKAAFRPKYRSSVLDAQRTESFEKLAEAKRWVQEQVQQEQAQASTEQAVPVENDMAAFNASKFSEEQIQETIQKA